MTDKLMALAREWCYAFSGTQDQDATPAHVLLSKEKERALRAAITEALVDAERYRWLREQDWFSGELCVLRDPKRALTSGKGLGADCPTRDRLDAAIDAAKEPK